MNRRERLMATLNGKPVDRPAVSFYELNGVDERPEDSDPFNIFSHPSWLPLIDLPRDRTDRIVLRSVAFDTVLPDPLEDMGEVETFMRDGSRIVVRTIQAGDRTLTSRTRQDPDIKCGIKLHGIFPDMFPIDVSIIIRGI